jgi:TP901 family phage tail tape measure protein
MANIELKIVALGDFSSVNNQIKALQAQVELLQKGVAGVGLNSQLSSQLKSIQSDFSSALMSSGNFTKSTVQLTSETEKFGKALQSGKLSLSQYFGIITGKSSEAQKAVGALAVEQVKLNNSIVQSDITKQGVYSVYTPTKINELSKSTEIAAAKQNIYNLAVREGSNQLINFGKNTQWAGRQLTVGLSMPAILFGSQAVTAFKAVNTELTRLQRLYGLGLNPPSQAQIDKISGQVLDLGKNIASSMGIAQSETVKVAANFAAMGKEGQALLDITTQTQRLSKLGAIDATQATNTIVSLQNVYKVSTNDLANAVNFMSSMQKQTTMSLQDMTDAIPRVGPIMAQLGGSYKDTAVMLLAMREAGVPAAQAANALKSAFASMIAPTSAASKEFAKFGVNLDSIKNAGSPVKMLMSLQSALVGIAPLAREQLIEKLFGKFQFARVSALLDNFGKVGSQTQNALKVAGATNAQLATLAGQEMAQATESTTAKWHRAIETLKADLYPIGQKILEVGTKIIDFGQKIADFFNKLPGPIKSGLGILLTLGVISGPIIMITGLLANLMGQGMKVGYALLGIVDGTKKWKDLMTPASIAAKTATEVFNEGLLTNVASVDALNAALQRMITSLTEINMTRTGGTGGILGAVEQVAVAEAGLAGGKIPFKMPGMATGGFIPGSGDTDSFPAMLMPGEAVIPKGPAQKYQSFISAMIDGRLPGYVYGTPKVGPSGKNIPVALSHASSPHGQDVLDELRTPELIAEQQGRLTAINAAPRGSLLVGPASVNEDTKGGKLGLTGKEIAQKYRDMMAAGTNPLSKALDTASKIGADTVEAEKKLSAALDDLLKHLETTAADTRFGAPDKYGVDASAAEAAKKGQKHGGMLEALTGSYMDPAAERVTAKGKSGRIWSLGEIQQNFIGTRGEGAGRSSSKDPGTGLGTTGRGYFRDPDTGKISIWSKGRAASEFPKLSQSDYAPDFSTSGSGAYRGVDDVKKMAKTTGAQLGSEVDNGFRGKDGIDAHSNSKKGIKAAEDYVGGVKQGLDEGKAGVAEEADKLINNVDNSISGKFSKAFGSGSRLSGMMSKFSGMGMMGKMGVGMGLGAVTQMASPLIDKLPGGNLISDAMSGAAMGAGFGPWGMAAGAALSLVSGGIKSLMAQEKLHKQESEADFKSSADAVQFLGGQVADVTTKMRQFNIVSTDPIIVAAQEQKNLSKGIQYTTKQLSDFNSVVKSLTPDNPLALIIKQVKDAGDNQSAAKLAQQFATVQMAINGINQSQATQLAQLIMTVSGKNASSTSVSAANQIEAIKNSVNAALPNTKQFQQVIGQLLTEANNTTSMVAFENIIKGIGSSAATSAQQLQAMLGYYKSIGDSSNSTLISMLMRSGQNWTASDVAAMQKSIANGNEINLDNQSAGHVKVIGQSQTLIDLNKQLNDLTAKQTAIQNGSTSAISANTAATANNVKTLTAEQKLLDAKLKSLQDLQKQQNQNTSYATTETDLKNQILMAQSTGDNLKAQMLKQQLLGTTRDYKLQGQVDAAQNAADANRLKVDNANNAASAAQTAATTGNTKALEDLGTNISNLQAQIAALTAKGGITSSIGAGTRSDPLNNIIQSSVPSGGLLPLKGISTASGKSSTQQQREVNSFLSQNGLKNGQFFIYKNQLYVVKGDQFVRASVDPSKGDSGKLQPRGHGGNGLADGTYRYASGGVARTNSSITYHKQHMNRQARHFDTGGHITGPGNGTSDSIPAMLSNGEYVIKASAVAHYGKGTFDALNAVRLAKGGVARTNSSITYHKQHMNRQARHFASGGYVPSSVSGLMSLSHPAFASGGFVNAPVSANNGNIVYNINVSAPGGSANEIAKVVMETLKQADQRMAMSGRKTRVGN